MRKNEVNDILQKPNQKSNISGEKTEYISKKVSIQYVKKKKQDRCFYVSDEDEIRKTH